MTYSYVLSTRVAGLPGTVRWCFAMSSALLLCLVLAGCRSAMYRAAKLPQELRCPPTTNTDVINLARVGGQSAGSAQLGPGDLLEVTIASGRQSEQPAPTLVRVASDGTVGVPLVGPVPVAGLEAVEAEQNISAAAINRGIFRHPVVSIDLKKKAVNRITVIGAVAEPGVHELPRGSSDLLSALAAAGGLSEEAGTSVEIMRKSPSALAQGAPETRDGDVQLASYSGQASEHPYPTTAHAGGAFPPPPLPKLTRVDLTSADESSQVDYRLNDGDVVTAFKRETRFVHVAGLVKKPGQFEIPVNQDIHLLDAIAMAGGRASPVADKVIIIRRPDDQGEPVVVQASIAKCKHNGRENIRLAHGDMISVEQTPETIVVDTVMSFFRVTVGLASNATFL